MKWEELKVYRPLAKEELKPAFKDFTKIVAANLAPFGFSLVGRKLIARSNDLLQIIHLDTRGSWTGISDHFKTEIALLVVSDKSHFFRSAELTGSKRIEDIIIGIRDNYRITKEYALLADFLTRKIIDVILPYFDKYNSSEKILSNRDFFKLGNQIENNENLILFCELQNRINIDAEKIIDKTLGFYSMVHPDKSPFNEYREELKIYKQGLLLNNWTIIEQKLQANETEVLRKIKLIK
jgi:hypothetical protein